MSELKIGRVFRAEAIQAQGVAIVIDVIRAFTVAAYAFANGAQELWLVRTTDEAFALRAKAPTALLAGEVGGRLIPGFDFNNSPARMSTADVQGKLLIQRTGAGTQGAVGAIHATHILLCALTNAQATASYARTLAEATGGVVTLLPTGTASDFAYGDEDTLCADYVQALLQERADAAEVLAKGVADLQASNRFNLWETGDADFPVEDITAVLDANRFHFAMVGTRQEWQGIQYVDVHRVEVS